MARVPRHPGPGFRDEAPDDVLTLGPTEIRGITTSPAHRQTQLDEQIERVWALEAAFVRRLARHDTGEHQGKPACRCERSRWLRTLFADDLGGRPRRERVTLTTDPNVAESPSQQIEQTEIAIAAAESRIDELRRRVDQHRARLRAPETAKSTRVHAARSYDWCGPPRTGSARIAPVAERASGTGVLSRRVRDAGAPGCRSGRALPGPRAGAPR